MPNAINVLFSRKALRVTLRPDIRFWVPFVLVAGVWNGAGESPHGDTTISHGRIERLFRLNSPAEKSVADQLGREYPRFQFWLGSVDGVGFSTEDHIAGLVTPLGHNWEGNPSKYFIISKNIPGERSQRAAVIHFLGFVVSSKYILRDF
jgi:hypothetical protein